jgi:hypothetical protein
MIFASLSSAAGRKLEPVFLSGDSVNPKYVKNATDTTSLTWKVVKMSKLASSTSGLFPEIFGRGGTTFVAV